MNSSFELFDDAVVTNQHRFYKGVYISKRLLFISVIVVGILIIILPIITYFSKTCETQATISTDFINSSLTPSSISSTSISTITTQTTSISASTTTTKNDVTTNLATSPIPISSSTSTIPTSSTATDAI